MTYAVALRLEHGLVFAADTRTNAGIDNIAQYRKLQLWCNEGDRVLVLLGSGNLAITQSVVSLLNEAMAEHSEGVATLLNAPNMYRAARVVGDALREGRRIDGPALEASKSDFRLVSSSAARSRASARACSRFIRRAISSRPPTTRRFYKSVSTSMASRSSTAWRGPTCALAKPPS